MTTIAAVLVTFNRKEIISNAVTALQAQSRPVDAIFVVDNASSDGTGEMLADRFPSVNHILMPSNVGASGGFEAGVRQAYESGHDWVWVFNDDTETEPDALMNCLAAADALDDPKMGIVWPLNETHGEFDYGNAWRGRPIRFQEPQSTEAYEADLVTFNGALISRAAIEAVGYPRGNYFLGFWEWEYCLRVKGEGFKIWVNPTLGVHHLHVGSAERNSLPWRGYYQTRNQLVMAIQRRSPVEVYRWMFRQVRFTVATLLYLDQKGQRIRLRFQGAFDALLGRMGRTVDPASFSTK